jgi:hypothetical protein
MIYAALGMDCDTPSGLDDLDGWSQLRHEFNAQSIIMHMRGWSHISVRLSFITSSDTCGNDDSEWESF